MTGRSDADIKALCGSATPGPWEEGDGWVYTSPVYEDDNRLSSVLGMKFTDPDRAMAESARVQPNVEFIAAARDLVPELLARAQQAEAEAAAYCERYGNQMSAGQEICDENDRLRAELAEYREAVVVANKAWANEAAKVQAVEALCERAISPHQETGEAWTVTDLAEQVRAALAAASSEPEDEPKCSTCGQPFDSPPCCKRWDGTGGGAHTVAGGVDAVRVHNSPITEDGGQQ